MNIEAINYCIEESASTLIPYQALGQAEFFNLMQASGLDAELQQAESSDTRFPYLYQPQPFIVVARLQEEDGVLGEPVGMASFIRMGDYNFLSTLAVHRDYQRKGIGQELIHRGLLFSRQQYKSPTDDGYASLVTLMITHTLPEEKVSNPAFKKFGFRKLENAAALLRLVQSQQYSQHF